VLDEIIVGLADEEHTDQTEIWKQQEVYLSDSVSTYVLSSRWKKLGKR
jgi:hypothetical protein